MRSLQGCQWRGTKRGEPEQFSNFEYFTTHNYGFVGENGQEWCWISACMCMGKFKTAFSTLPASSVSDYHTTIIPGLASIRRSLVPSLRVQHRTKRTVMQRECEAQRNGSNNNHNHTQLLSLTVSFFSSNTSLLENPLILFFHFFFCLIRPCITLYICHTQSVSFLQ